jgi:hypothetical protein
MPALTLAASTNRGTSNDSQFLCFRFAQSESRWLSRIAN